MEDSDNKDLITRMKAVLREYEEPYVDGAWEEFSGSKKSVRPVSWKWLSVAAMLLVAGSVWLLYPEDQIDNVPAVVSLRKPIVLKPQKQAPIEQNDKVRLAERAGGKSLKDLPTVQREANRIARAPHTELAINGQELTAAAPAEASTVMARVAEPTQSYKAQFYKKSDIDTATGPVAAKSTFMDFLKEEQVANQSQAVAKVDSHSKWDFGVELLPTVSNSAVNVGAGLMTEYKLSKHFSVGSGISFVQLQAGKALTPGVSMLSSRQLQAVDANFRGIDIPLNLVYNINKNLYTSIGVSYFNVIQENSQNTFVAEREVSSLATDPVTGLTANVRTFVSETMQEPSSETMLNGKSYIGFFNFSIGRKQEVFKKYNIFIEPFIKLPVGKLSQQDLQLTNGGMKFKVAF